MRCSAGTSIAGDSSGMRRRLRAGRAIGAPPPPGPPFRNALIGPMPHAVTKTERNTQGIHARTSAGARDRAGRAVPGPARAASPAADGNSQISAGFHHVQNNARQPSDTRPPMMSTSSGPT